MFNKSKNIVAVFFLFVLVTNKIVFPQLMEEKILAKIGENIIYQSDFENRLNFSPKIGIQDKSKSEGIKKELLYTMIAEKLWTNSAYEQGLDNEELSIAAKNVIEKMFVRDELYHREIKNKINISDDDFSKALEKSNVKLELTIFYSQDESSIFNISNKLSTINKNMPINDDAVSIKKMTIGYGDLDKEIEEIVYQLKTDEYSGPINNNGIWSIYKLEDKIENKFVSKKEKDEVSKKIKKILNQRNENSKYDEFHERFFSGKAVDVNGILLSSVINELQRIFDDKLERGLFVENNDQKIIYFDKVDLGIIKTNLGRELLAQELIKFDKNPVSVNNFLNELNVLAFNVSEPGIEFLKNKLNAKMKEYIKHELLAREGIRIGLDKSPNVQKWVKIWYENYLFKTIKSRFLSSKGKTHFEDFSISDNDYKMSRISDENLDKYEEYINKTIELSEKYNIEIDFPLFSKIQQGNISLFVLRHLGFGGTISGVPTTQPFIEWYLKKENKSKKYL